MIPVTLQLLDSGTWTLDAPMAHVHVVARVQSSHRREWADGTTQEGQQVQLRELGGIVQLRLLDTGACFTFPASTRRRHRIEGVAYERVCEDGLRFWARATRGRRCR